MNRLLVILFVVFTTTACAQGAKQPEGIIQLPTPVHETKVVVETKDNCVKKDSNGKCPPLPNSPKPTPK